MAAKPSSETGKSTEAPAPEVLKPQTDQTETASKPESGLTAAEKLGRLRHGSYRPSHKATFVGLAVVIGILLINGAVIYFVLRGQSSGGDTLSRDEVTLSTEALDSLGFSRNNVGELGTQLTVGPDTSFSGKVTIAGDVSVGGQFKLNSKLVASDASLAKLQAGETAVETLNVNGDTTSSNLNLRKDLSVTGLTRLQGPVTMSQLLTVTNSVNITGNLAIGGSLSVRNFQVSTLTVAGHLISTGAAPGVSGGGALGSNGTVSISGNDTAGTVGVNIGAGAAAGCLASVSYRQAFTATPHVVVTGSMTANLYLTSRTAGGFTVCTATPLTPGGYFIDYIVVQ